MPIQTLTELFQVAVEHDKPDCLQHKVDGSFRPISTSELVETVRKLTTILENFGVERGDRVALMAENGPHWPAVDFATLCQGAVLVPIYPTLTPDQAAYIAHDCGARILFVQGAPRLAGMLADSRQSMPGVEHFVLIDGDSSTDAYSSLEQLLTEAKARPEPSFRDQAERIEPDDPATFIYTSGTTGNPKGVMLSHRNIASNVVNGLKRIPVERGWTALSFLPLSHSFERTVDYIYFHQGVSIAYAESVQAVGQNLQEVRPHLFVSVPRVYEKILARIQENVATSSPAKQRIFSWAEEVAGHALPFRLERKSPGGSLGIKLALADKLVFGKLRSRLGDRFQFAISGGAPLPRELAEFFWGAGIEIYEGYGLSETSPILAANGPRQVRMGTVGRPIPETEIAIAEDGEILARGPQIMLGYFNMPEATAEAIDSQRWFHTGDIGEIDDDGYLKITDRKKEIIVNAYGKNVAPAPIENALKSSPFIAQAVVVGDRRKFLSALLVPDFDNLSSWAKRRGLSADALPSLLAEPQVKDLLDGEVARVNRDLARYEQIRVWEVLPEEFTIESGELTPTQKIKRRVILRKFGRQIEAMYDRASAAPDENRR
jgi:long-chain acyl-CoA synthetase